MIAFASILTVVDQLTRPNSMRMPLRSSVLVLVALAGTLGAQVAQSEYAQRRADFLSRLPDTAVAIVLGAGEPREDFISFFQTPRFWYLTGYLEPDASLLLVKRGARSTATIFVAPRDPAREAWTGTRLGPAGAAALTGMMALPASSFRPAVDSALAGARTLYVLGDLDASAVLSADDQLVASMKRTHPGLQIADASILEDSLRARHSDAEFALLRHAIEITADAQRAVLKVVAPGVGEYEVQATIEYTFRRAGAERPSFSSIVGSGPNSTSLHYDKNERVMLAGELVVMDIGASWRGYAADVTRTLPVNGVFTPDQRALYQVVRDAQAAAERQAVVGRAAHIMSDSANAVLAAGLVRLGLIESADALYDAPRGSCTLEVRDGCRQLSLYYDHALGHGIGLEVHDSAPWYYPPYLILPGAAFTIEPGLYVRGNALDILPDTPRNRALIAKVRPAFERFRDTGVRIEDDYFATATGVEWISRAPREIAEIEAAMKR
jgi:Xaa-Pro aminopeptidase